MKKRDITVMEKYGFTEDDLENPLHDRICIWLEDHMQEIIKQLFVGHYHGEKLSPKEIDSYIETSLEVFQDDKARFGNCVLSRDRQKYIDILRNALNAYKSPPFTVDSIIWGPAVCTNPNFALGFLDIAVAISIPVPTIQKKFSQEASNVQVEVHTNLHTKNVWFKVKSSIPSLELLFRQLTFYRKHIDDTIVIVSPDIIHRDRIQQQGYLFLEAPKSMTSKENSYVKESRNSGRVRNRVKTHGQFLKKHRYR